MAIVSILIDTREPEWIRNLTFGGVATSNVALDAGDLLVATESGDLLAVERKAASDFLNTLRDDRLFPQLVKLRELTPWAYLALCGSLMPGAGGKVFVDGKETGWSWASVAGALLTVQEIGVHVLHVQSDADFEGAIIRLANRDRGTLRTRPARQAEFVSEAEAILSALPGVGPEKAQVLLEHCGSAAWALRYLTDPHWEGLKAPGVGAGIRQRIRRALALPDWAILGVLAVDGDNEVAVDPPQQKKKEKNGIR